MHGVRPDVDGEVPAVLDRFSFTSDRAKENLKSYVGLLEKWQTTHNLVSALTLNQVWSRHVLDSAQLIEAVPAARRWADLGSGAGFPGMVIAIMCLEVFVAFLQAYIFAMLSAVFIGLIRHPH